MFLLLLPVLLVGPALLLAAVVVDLWSRGPLGAAAALGLPVALWLAARWSARRLRAWWRGTKAPDLDIPPARRVRHNE